MMQMNAGNEQPSCSPFHAQETIDKDLMMADLWPATQPQQQLRMM